MQQITWQKIQIESNKIDTEHEKSRLAQMFSKKLGSKNCFNASKNWCKNLLQIIKKYFNASKHIQDYIYDHVIQNEIIPKTYILLFIIKQGCIEDKVYLQSILF